MEERVNSARNRDGRDHGDGLGPDLAARVRWAVTEGLGLKGQPAEVVILLALGLDEEAIAVRLSIQPVTVHDHVKTAYKSVGVHSRQKLLAKVIEKMAQIP